MTTKDFMSRVMAWPGDNIPGWVNLECATKPKKPGAKAIWGGTPHRDVDRLLSQAAAEAPYADVYFCLSTQAEVAKNPKTGALKSKRGAPKALALKAIWLDIDVKAPPKGYATIEEAVQALAKFLRAANLPYPTATVKSGGGLHAYWISDEPLTREKWQPYANGLRALAQKAGLLCDYGVTTDAARVLRVPGTLNYKTDPPKPVELLRLLPDDISFQTKLAHLPSAGAGLKDAPLTAAVKPSFDLSAFQGHAPIPVTATDKLSDGLAHTELPIDAKKVILGCEVYREAVTTGGKDHQQPLWNLLMLGNTFMGEEDAEKMAHMIGSKHPGYTKDSTNEMLARKLRERTQNGIGWPSCAAFQNEGCKQCALCPSKGKINSPLKLGMPVAKLAPTFPAPPQAGAAALLDLPVGYVLDANGWIMESIEIPDPSGGPPGCDNTPLFYCKLFTPYASRDASTERFHFVTETSLGQTRNVTIEGEILPDYGALCRRMTGQGVKLNVDAQPKIRRFIMSWLARLHQARTSTAAAPFGWYRIDGKVRGFIYGGSVLRDDGTTEPATHPDAAIAATYRPRGDLQPWLDAFDLVKGRPALEAIVAASFGAPILALTGQTGSLMFCWGSGGENKTTAMDIAVSVWGSGHTKETTNATPKSLIKKMGALKNLPLFWDEIQDEGSQKKVFDIVFSNTEGVSYSKLNSDGVYQEKTDWQTICIAASNYSFVEYVAKRQKQTTAGMDRVFEYEVPPRNFESGYATHEGDLLRSELRINQFGAAGWQYSKFLAENHARLAAEVKATLDELDEELKPSQRERYWKSLVASILCGAKYANEVVGSSFDVPALRVFLLDTFRKNRQRIVEEATDGSRTVNTEAVLNHFLGQELAQRTITTGPIKAGPGRKSAVHVYHAPRQEMMRDALTVQRIIDQPDYNEIRFYRRAFIEFLEANKYSSTPVMKGLKALAATTIRGHLAVGITGFTGTRAEMFCLPVPPGSPYEMYLYGNVPDDLKPERVRELIAEEQRSTNAAISSVVTAAVIEDQQTVENFAKEAE